MGVALSGSLGHKIRRRECGGKRKTCTNGTQTGLVWGCVRSEEYLYYARMQAGGTNRAGNHGLERRHEHGHERGHERGRARRVNEHGDGRGHGLEQQQG